MYTRFIGGNFFEIKWVRSLYVHIGTAVRLWSSPDPVDRGKEGKLGGGRFRVGAVLKTRLIGCP